MAARWIDLVEPTREDLLASLPVQVDPDVIEALVARPTAGREPRPLLEAHGSYVFGVLAAARPIPLEDRVVYQEVDLVVTPGVVVTVRKTPGDGSGPFEVATLHAAVEQGATAGELVHRLVDEIADSLLEAIDAAYAEIDELEDGVDSWPPSRVRARVSDLRHELLHSRRAIAATRAAVRRVLDGRVDVGEHDLFPAEIERLFADTYEKLVRMTEELDVARELLAGVRDHHQSRVVETQGDVVKKLTIIASLVLVPTLIVGYYGQNFESSFDDHFWSLGVSTGLIVVTTLIQLAVYRWRRWI